MDKKEVLVAILMGSASDADVMKGCVELLQTLEVPHEVRILSAHRTPDQTRAYVAEAEARGVRVFIAGAGWAAHLAGFVAGHTHRPVIGVPIDSSPLKGFDALLATVQMPPGVPVATVSVGKGGAKNAAVLAAQILSLTHPDLDERLRAYREEQTRKVLEAENPWRT
ncbi:MAG: 5-(carboxyamino)imidazole ribonucleotide mutase [Deltaproteobacteria bacterium]|nr:5-(carboxyamino)imidazole ribonucleotide mutase [Deltaproteobacteria bacterium]MBW1922192.1 5-(carboxyamino)imidazole ribonucleotide mutase [Deltaproteobacteria bacterium]MBW1950240.1 5-(carboxyamino)imidazole ribonucleotide mutase [Deltaproteobacteria bacterium]MBW2006825.1 5-(carboxyamino)imidazole ribonucleotide mutase [Deltaproteobacteria bacterium]MBW2347073.1 5-(carboxyamino)imidazole ribonucleotide mutase [Deltaproteobacteria bacterium]